MPTLRDRYGVEWLRECLRKKALRFIEDAVEDGSPESPNVVRRIKGDCESVGDIIDVYYYVWEYHNDVNGLLNMIKEAIEEYDK